MRQSFIAAVQSEPIGRDHQPAHVGLGQGSSEADSVIARRGQRLKAPLVGTVAHDNKPQLGELSYRSDEIVDSFPGMQARYREQCLTICPTQLGADHGAAGVRTIDAWQGIVNQAHFFRWRAPADNHASEISAWHDDSVCGSRLARTRRLLPTRAPTSSECLKFIDRQFGRDPGFPDATFPSLIADDFDDTGGAAAAP